MSGCRVGRVRLDDENVEIALSWSPLSRWRHQLGSAIVFRFQLRLRDIEELLFERGVTVTYETIRCWCDEFGADFVRAMKATRRKPGGTWHLDEMFVTLRG